MFTEGKVLLKERFWKIIMTCFFLCQCITLSDKENSILFWSWTIMLFLIILSEMIALHIAFKKIETTFLGTFLFWLLSIKPPKITNFCNYWIIQMLCHSILLPFPVPKVLIVIDKYASGQVSGQTHIKKLITASSCLQSLV